MDGFQYLTKVEICDKSKVYLNIMKDIPVLIMLDKWRVGYQASGNQEDRQ